MPLLHWLTRDVDIHAASQTPYRLLEHVEEHSHGDSEIGNMLVQGDNLDALKALLPYYAGKVKCIYIDPPYNTGAAHFEYYDDNLAHTQWLAMMYPRLDLLRQLLSPDGFFCCHIDDSEGPYLKIILDEILGRNNYLSTLFVQVRYASKTLKQDMSFHKQIEQVFVFRSSRAAKPVLPSIETSFEKFCYYVEVTTPTSIIDLGGKKVEVFYKGSYKIEKRPSSKDGLKEIWATGTILDGNSSGRFFRDYLSGRYEVDGLNVLYRVHGIGDDSLPYRYFTGPKRTGATKGKYFQGIPQSKLDSEGDEGSSPIENYYDLSGSFGNCRHEGGVEFRSGKKPEILIKLILDRFSCQGDIVMDSFLGSGTTAAVAHKMGRRYIGIEMGDHAISHCVPRLHKVIDGEQGGISEAVEWKGGGGFRFYKLGVPVFDENGHISPGIRFAPLAAHLWFVSTGIPYRGGATSPFLGEHEGVGYYLLYNGILGDLSPDGGNVLTGRVLTSLPNHVGPKVIFGESCRLSAERLETNRIIFRQIPYEIKAR
jgi:adenine-specific DNA-methyltransferase